MRYHDLPEIVRVAAPVHVKFTVRNAPNTYPAGGHLTGVVTTLAAEQVRRERRSASRCCTAATRPPAPAHGRDSGLDRWETSALERHNRATRRQASGCRTVLTSSGRCRVSWGP